MGKASTSKKVARAARAGGTTHREGRKIGYPLAIVAIIVIGLGLVIYARHDRDTSGTSSTVTTVVSDESTTTAVVDPNASSTTVAGDPNATTASTASTVVTSSTVP